MSASIEVIHSHDTEAPKWKHTESIIVQTAQQMKLCLRTNKSYGLKWHCHFKKYSLKLKSRSVF